MARHMNIIRTPQRHGYLAKISTVKKRSSFLETQRINITTEVRRLLGAAIGQSSFVNRSINNLVERFSHWMEVLAKIAQSQPQAAYTVLTKG